MPDASPPLTLSEALACCLEEEAQCPERFAIPGGHVERRAPGVLALIPSSPCPGAAATLISVGIHGDETAPIELLGQVAARLDAGLIRLGAPALLVVGHAPAVRLGQRYLDTNLNRLFRRDPPEAHNPSLQEHARATELMATVDAFWTKHGGPDDGTLAGGCGVRLHLDLHTAIRDSHYPRFAVEPFSDTPTPPSLWPVMAGAGLQAALYQHTHSWTFSHYSRHYHGVVAFTLELGRVAPFGANDLDALAPMGAWLAARLSGVPPVEAPIDDMVFFRVEHELMRHGEHFELAFDEAIANFTRFEAGELIARDPPHGDYRVEQAPLYVVFPNARVEQGARAALLVRSIATPLERQ